MRPRIAAARSRDRAAAQRAAEPELAALDDVAIELLGDGREPDPGDLAAALADLGAPDATRTAQAREEESPDLAGGDVDAATTETGSGEEAVGGSTPTPDQDNVDEIGAALGVEYQPDEPLRPVEKIARRDDERWELNPASSEDFAERQDLDLHRAAPARRRRGR